MMSTTKGFVVRIAELRWVILAVVILLVPAAAQAQVIVPGTGKVIAKVGDDFEDPNWNYKPNLPKVYNNKDDTISRNDPGGRSANGRWYEGMKRGQPDFVKRVSTPIGGLPGSTGALAIRSLKTGGRSPSYQQQQEDLIADVAGLVGKIPASRGPNVVARVWLPPLEQWDQRVGCHFAMRMTLENQYVAIPRSRGLFGRKQESTGEETAFWPGIFVNLSRDPKAEPGTNPYFIYFWMKATESGHQIRGPKTTQTGWWTLGMSVSPDQRVHYFAKPGIDDLTAADHLGSAYPFGRRAERLRTFFFNVCNGDDGRTWSTPFIIDDPTLYVAR